MELNPNLTQVLIQLGIYLALIFILKSLYFEPIIALLKRRESMTTGRADEAVELRKKTEALRAQYEARMTSLGDQLERERHEAIRLVREKADKKIAEARAGIDKKLENHHREVVGEGQKLQAKLPDISLEVSKEIVNAIVGSRVVRA